MSSPTPFDRVIAVVGGPKKLADILGTSIQNVSNWRDAAIPAKYCKRIEAETGISVKVMRPHDWQAYWPELAEPTKSTA